MAISLFKTASPISNLPPIATASTYIHLESVGKRFRYEWIFRNLSTQFESGKAYALLGPNGSGKSTLMKILSGHLSPSSGKIHFSHLGKRVDEDAVYKHISYAAPYIELVEELTLTEAIGFYAKFKPLVQRSSSDSHALKVNDLIEILGFQKSKDKEIRYFSSGMKQRLKLALAICSQTPILLLDEPTTNLDAQGIRWYRDLISRFTEGGQRLILIASNIEHDYDFCTEYLTLLDYKNS
jgi:ABC-type multidrug transport system ATPase subunit